MLSTAARRVSSHTASRLSAHDGAKAVEADLLGRLDELARRRCSTSTSSEPYAAITAATSSLAASGSRTSHASGRHSPPRARIAAAVSSSSSARRPATATRAPSSASNSAVARPMPVPPPVTSAERPVRLPSRRTLSTRPMIGRGRRCYVVCGQCLLARARLDRDRRSRAAGGLDHGSGVDRASALLRGVDVVLGVESRSCTGGRASIATAVVLAAVAAAPSRRRRRLSAAASGAAIATRAASTTHATRRRVPCPLRATCGAARPCRARGPRAARLAPAEMVRSHSGVPLVRARARAGRARSRAAGVSSSVEQRPRARRGTRRLPQQVEHPCRGSRRRPARRPGCGRACACSCSGSRGQRDAAARPACDGRTTPRSSDQPADHERRARRRRSTSRRTPRPASQRRRRAREARSGAAPRRASRGRPQGTRRVCARIRSPVSADASA